jgi:hypothetical protein
MKRTLIALAVVAMTSVSAVGTASATTLTVRVPCGCPVVDQEVGVPWDSPALDNGSALPGSDVKPGGRVATFVE